MLPESVRNHFPSAREEADNSITLPECPVCEAEGHHGKSVKLFRDRSGRISGVSCSRYAASGGQANQEHCAPIREQLGLAGHPSNAFVSSTLFNGDRQITIELERVSKHVQFLTARNCADVLYSAELRVTRPDERAAFVAAIPERSDAERETVGRALVQLLDRFRRAQSAVDEEPSQEEERLSAATRLVRLAEGLQLVHNADGEGYAVLKVDGHKETWPLRSKGFKRWLQRRFFEQYEKAPGAQAVQDALGVIEGKALYDGPERKIFIRVGEKDGRIYLDLADDRWRAVEIGADDWRIVDIPPVEFRRAKGMLPLAAPDRGGSLDELRPFLNLEKGDLWTLMLGSLVMKLHPRGPYNVDVFTGGQGSGKTTRAKVIRSLVDPSSAATRSAPREIRDLQIAASNEWLPVFDNLSRIPEWLSDGFCCLSTGGGMRTRELYSDNEEAIFSTKRPLILTSITEVVERADLLDRSLIFNLPEIEKRKRKSEREFWDEFESARSRILGALLDAVVCALRNEDVVVIEEASRMADFERWVVAAEPALGFESGTFLRAYRKNQSSANDLALEACPITDPVIALAEAHKVWTGTAQELFDILLTEKSEDDKRKLKEQGWPKAPNGLSAMLRRLAPNLRIQGIGVEFGIRSGKKGSRKIRISFAKADPAPELKIDKEPIQEHGRKTSSEIVRSSAEPANKGLNHIEADDLPPEADGPADDPRPVADGLADDLCAAALTGQVTEKQYFPEPADGLTIADDDLPPYSCETVFVALDTETERFDEKRGVTPRNARMIGLALSHDGEGRSTYTTDREAWSLMVPEPEQLVVMHNAKFDLGVLRRAGLPEPARWEDTMIAAHLLDETGDHGLKPLAKERLGVDDPTTFEEADRMRLLDPGIFEEYAKNDARYTFRLWPKFKLELERQDLMTVYELEKSVVPAVMAMEAAGIKLDLARMKEMRDAVQIEADAIEAEIYEHAGCRFDLHSPKKVAAILFDKLDVPSRKETNGGQRSVDHEALEAVHGYHPAVEAILRYREIDKLASTFLSVLPAFADEAGRIHPEFKQLGPTSGRFSCANPNVQQIPVRSELGKKLRRMFVAREGAALVVADWSQMELRILAHYSKDPLLLEAYTSENKTDLHTLTAARMFGKAEADVSKSERSIAKMINFAIGYGVTPIGLFNRLRPQGLDVTEKQCEKFIEDYFRTYSGVKKFLNRVETAVRERGYVKSISGRRRRLSGHTQRELRQAKNFIMQGAAADLAKMAMVKLHESLPDGARLISVVHDEFICECRQEQAEVVRGLMIETMQTTPDGFIVPMLVEAKIAANWGDAK